MHRISKMTLSLWCKGQSLEPVRDRQRFNLFQEQVSPPWSDVVVEVTAIAGLSLEAPAVWQFVLHESVNQTTDRYCVKLRLEIVTIDFDAEVLDRSLRIASSRMLLNRSDQH